MSLPFLFFLNLNICSFNLHCSTSKEFKRNMVVKDTVILLRCWNSECWFEFCSGRAGAGWSVWDHLPGNAECSWSRCSFWHGSRRTCHVSMVCRFASTLSFSHGWCNRWGFPWMRGLRRINLIVVVHIHTIHHFYAACSLSVTKQPRDRPQSPLLILLIYFFTFPAWL